MLYRSIFQRRLPSLNLRENRLTSVQNSAQALSPPSSRAARSLALASAIALVVASAGFGAYYAWSTGSQHGVMLASLSVLFAVALECCKPLSLAAALSSFGSLRIVRGAALALLACVAIVYSLTAELTLMAGARGDVVAGRQAALNANADVEAEVQRARDRYEAAKAELASMPIMRSVAEVQSEIGAIDQLPGIVVDGAPCGGTLNGKTTREWCPRRSALMAEKARAERRADLEAIVAKPLPVPVHSGGEHEVRNADPAASALVAYAAALGFKIAPGLLTEWLALIPVLALEISSALAAVLVGAYGPGPARLPVESAATAVQAPALDQPLDHLPAQAGPVQKRSSRKRRDRKPPDDPPAGPSKRGLPAVLVALQGGKAVQGSQRAIAKALGTSKTTVHRALQLLEVEGFAMA